MHPREWYLIVLSNATLWSYVKPHFRHSIHFARITDLAKPSRKEVTAKKILPCCYYCYYYRRKVPRTIFLFIFNRKCLCVQAYVVVYGNVCIMQFSQCQQKYFNLPLTILVIFSHSTENSLRGRFSPRNTGNFSKRQASAPNAKTCVSAPAAKSANKSFFSEANVGNCSKKQNITYVSLNKSLWCICISLPLNYFFN